MKVMDHVVNQKCSVARASEVLGAKWVPLILREALHGRTRFAEFREIGIATDMLTDRLNLMVESGLLARQPYRDASGRERQEYVPTPAAVDAIKVLAALSEWSDTYQPLPKGPHVRYVHTDTGSPVRLAFVDSSGHEVSATDVVAVRGTS